MIRLSVCIEPFFSQLSCAERIRRIAELNVRLDLTTAAFVFNHPDGGIRASLIKKKDRSKLLDNIEAMTARAKWIGRKAFISGSGNTVRGLAREKALDCMVESLSAVGKGLPETG